MERTKTKNCYYEGSFRKSGGYNFYEPTSGLDYENKMRIKNLIYDLGEKTVILITHDKDLIESEGYLNILKNGKIQEGQ